MTEAQADWFLGSGFRDLVAYFLLFAFLILKPGGLFGRPGGEASGSDSRRA